MAWTNSSRESATGGDEGKKRRGEMGKRWYLHMLTNKQCQLKDYQGKEKGWTIFLLLPDGRDLDGTVDKRLVAMLRRGHAGTSTGRVYLSQSQDGELAQESKRRRSEEPKLNRMCYDQAKGRGRVNMGETS